MNILSLGAGVQSSALLLMSCKGILPKLDAAIFADTQFESKETYKYLTWLIRYAKKCGVPIHKITAGNIKEDNLNAVFGVRRGTINLSLPYFVKNQDGTIGRLRRQCTADYKIRPIHTYIRRQLLGLAKGRSIPKDMIVYQWMGISLDEEKRAKPSRIPRVIHTFPLIEKKYTRAHCIDWMQKNNFPLPARSACLCCPYKSNDEWRRLRDDSPQEWQDVITFDKLIRNEKLYLHRSCLPLEEVEL